MKSPGTIKRTVIISIILPVVVIFLIYAFSKTINYSIIFALGSVISITGYLVMINQIDRFLKKGEGRFLFAVAFVKMAVIAGGFYLASRISKTAVLMYMMGLSVIVAAIMIEALIHMCRIIFKWKNTN